MNAKGCLEKARESMEKLHEQKMFTLNETAEALGITYNQMYHLIRRKNFKNFPYMSEGGGVLRFVAEKTIEKHKKGVVPKKRKKTKQLPRIEKPKEVELSFDKDRIFELLKLSCTRGIGPSDITYGNNLNPVTVTNWVTGGLPIPNEHIPLIIEKIYPKIFDILTPSEQGRYGVIAIIEREKRGKTELAGILGCKVSTLTKILSKRVMPSREFLYKVVSRFPKDEFYVSPKKNLPVPSDLVTERELAIEISDIVSARFAGMAKYAQNSLVQDVKRELIIMGNADMERGVGLKSLNEGWIRVKQVAEKAIELTSVKK